MTKELEQKLYERFSFFHPELPQTVSLMCFGFECGDGWFDLIWELCEKIEEIENIIDEPDKKAKQLLLGEENINVFQVKEKFGTLRFYIDGVKRETQELVNEYENKSAIICEKCGKPGERRTGGWVKTLCDNCNKEKK